MQLYNLGNTDFRRNQHPISTQLIYELNAQDSEQTHWNKLDPYDATEDNTNSATKSAFNSIL